MNNGRVLLVQAPARADEVEHRLADAGYEVTAADSATEAVAVVSRECVDCLVSGYALPGDDGLELFEAVRAVDGNTPFVLYADHEESLAADALEAGVDRVVGRDEPGSVERLVDELAEVLSSVGDLPERQDIAGHEPDPADIARAIDSAPVGIFLSDPSLPDNPLVYVNDAWQDITGYSREQVLGRNLRFLQGPGTESQRVEQLAEAISSETALTLEMRNYRRDGTPFWNELTVAPVRDADGEVTRYIGFHDEVTARKNAEELARERAARLTDEKQALRRVLDRVNGLLCDITDTMVEHDRRPALAQAVCDRVIDADGYVASWFGQLTAPGDNIDIVAGSGLPDGVDDSAPLSALPDAVGEALQSGSLELCSVDPDGGDTLNPTHAGARRLAAIPLVYREKTYGVLCVYGESIEVLDRREQQLFESIGTILASRLNAIETTEALRSDRVVEVKLDVRDSSFPLSRIAGEFGSEIEYIGMTGDTEADRYELFLATTSDQSTTALTSLDGVESVRTISRTDDAQTFAVTVDSATPFTELADHGGSVTRVTAAPESATVVLELSLDHDVRSVRDLLETLYDDVELRSRCERDSRERTSNEFTASVDKRLTGRQRAALKAAQMNGYFEWPRPTTGSEIAETMSITRQTFHQHLRAAERKLIETYIDDDSEAVTEQPLLT